MKKFDFTQTGGFPLTQDRLAFLQQGYVEALLGIAAAGGDTTSPRRVSGMEVSVSGSDYTVTDGWFVYNGELIRFIGATETITDTALVKITFNADSLDFQNGTTPAVKLEATATIEDGVSATDATRFPLADLKPWGREEDWTTVSSFGADYGTITGTLEYKKCWLTNVLHIRGQLTVTDSPPSALPLFGAPKITTLPAGYRPSASVFFSGPCTSFVKTSDSVSWLQSISVSVEADGDVTLYVPKTLADAAFNVKFSAVINLD